MIGKYRKTHLPFLGVDRYVKAGPSLPKPFNTTLGRIGTLICFDLRFPEAARVLSLNGAQIILAPSAWHHTSPLYPELLVPTRSAENRVFILAADQTGEVRNVKFLGRSLITNPDGKVLAEAGTSEETILYAEIDIRLTTEKKLIFKPGEFELDLFGQRRPDIYEELTRSSQ
jgi:predicted amidohydrolase